MDFPTTLLGIYFCTVTQNEIHKANTLSNNVAVVIEVIEDVEANSSPLLHVSRVASLSVCSMAVIFNNADSTMQVSESVSE